MQSGNIDTANLERKQVFFYGKEMTAYVLHLISSMSVVNGYALAVLNTVGSQESLQILISDMLEDIISVYFRKSYITFMLLFDECSTCYCPFSINAFVIFMSKEITIADI